jgi:hypothetical protein
MDVDRLVLVRLAELVERPTWRLIGSQAGQGPPAETWPTPGAVQHGPLPGAGRRAPVPPTAWRWDRGVVADPWRAAVQWHVVGLTRRLVDAAALVEFQQPGAGDRFLGAVMDDGWGVEGSPPALRLPRSWWRLVPPAPPQRSDAQLRRDLASALLAAGMSFDALGRSIEGPLRSAVVTAALRSLDAAADAAEA